MVVSHCSTDIVVDHEIDSKFIGKFKFVLTSDEYKFYDVHAEKDSGVFWVYAKTVSSHTDKYNIITV